MPYVGEWDFRSGNIKKYVIAHKGILMVDEIEKMYEQLCN